MLTTPAGVELCTSAAKTLAHIDAMRIERMKMLWDFRMGLSPFHFRDLSVVSDELLPLTSVGWLTTLDLLCCSFRRGSLFRITSFRGTQSQAIDQEPESWK